MIQVIGLSLLQMMEDSVWNKSVTDLLHSSVIPKRRLQAKYRLSALKQMVHIVKNEWIAEKRSLIYVIQIGNLVITKPYILWEQEHANESRLFGPKFYILP